MRPDRLERILRDLHVRPTRDADRGRSELEAELLARHERTTSRERGFHMMFLKRPVYVALLLAVLGIGACTVPTETEVEMGQRLTYTLDGKEMLGKVGDLVQFVEIQPGVDEVTINMFETDDGPMVIDLVVWGRGLDADQLAGRIAGAFPVVAGGRLETEELSTDVETSIAEKLGHDIFKFEIVAEGTDSEIKAQILEQIFETGFAGLADVDVNTEDGVTTIDVEMTHEGDGLETEDELTIDLIREDE